MATTFRRSPRAIANLRLIARPGLRQAAEAIAARIPGEVPVHHGVVVRTYHPVVEAAAESERVHVGSPFWHLLEYGTAHSPAYRPVEHAVRGLHLKWRAN